MKKRTQKGKSAFPALLLSILFFGQGLYAQQSVEWRIQGKSIVELKQEQNRILPLSPSFLNESTYLNRQLLIQKYNIPDQSIFLKPSLMPKSYRYRDLALFCRLEVKMERAFNFPVKFRLGEVQYVERMEGKY